MISTVLWKVQSIYCDKEVQRFEGCFCFDLPEYGCSKLLQNSDFSYTGKYGATSQMAVK
jgi:hypothetical protein